MLQRERASVEERQANLRAELETAGIAKAQREEAITLATQLARELRAELDRLAQEIADAQSAARALEERTRAAEAEAARLLAAAQDFHNRIARLAQQTETWQQERERLAQESEAHQLRLQQLQLELEAARIELHGPGGGIPHRPGASAILWARAWTRRGRNSRPGAKSAPRLRWRWRARNPTTHITRSNAAMN